MTQEELISVNQALCNHSNQRHYTQKRFDILNGFEIIENRCSNCHKILFLEIRKVAERESSRTEEGAL
jgi:hypothetical protein